MIAPLFRNILPEIWHPTLLRRIQVFPAFSTMSPLNSSCFQNYYPTLGSYIFGRLFRSKNIRRQQNRLILTAAIEHAVFHIVLRFIYVISNYLILKKKCLDMTECDIFVPLFSHQVCSVHFLGGRKHTRTISQPYVCIDYQAVPSGYITT
jgi:hypothetical protein